MSRYLSAKGEKVMAKVQLTDGRIVEAQLTDIRREGEEGSRSATALIEGREIPVYNSIVDGFTDIWTEQLTLDEWRKLSPEEKNIWRDK